MKAGLNLRGVVGTVLETWEKCQVDPTCCCAEQVDENMAVRVEFTSSADKEKNFVHYFAESELVLRRRRPNKASLLEEEEEEGKADDGFSSSSSSLPQSENLPFDGMSCVAFKLEQLGTEKKPRRIASSYDPSHPSNNADQ